METFIILIILLILSCIYDIISTLLHNLSAYIIIISPENLPLASSSPLLFKENMSVLLVLIHTFSVLSL